MWLTRTNVLIYSTHFLSSWGNHMWVFGMGMYMVRIADDTLRLSASSGLATGLAIFFFGPLVGDWVDRTKRLKATQMSLLLQDLLMLCCYAVVAVYLWLKDDIMAANNWLSPLIFVVIVALSVMSSLAAQARVIAVERDWVVEICGQNRDHLASLTAMLRRIDQVTEILAPMAAGQMMTYLGLIFSAVLISGWNLVSVVLEMFLIWKVYNTVPALRARKDTPRIADIEVEAKLNLTEGTTDLELTQNLLATPKNGNKTKAGRDQSGTDTNNTQMGLYQNGAEACRFQNGTGTGTQTETESEQDFNKTETNVDQPETDDSLNKKVALQNGTGASQNGTDKPQKGIDESQKGTDDSKNGKVALQNGTDTVADAEDGTETAGHLKLGASAGEKQASRGLLYQLLALYRGWRTYASYRVALAGLALAFLYMTVLSFHTITVAYVITQGLTEGMAGILMGASAAFGIIGTFAYPLIRRRVGLARTGFIALTSQVTCLTLCIVSIWMPGSPFDPFYTRRDAMLAARDRCEATQQGAMSLDSSVLLATTVAGFTNATEMDCSVFDAKHVPGSYLSVSFLLAGIFLGRFGVWTADLTITQLFMENVIPSQRGVVHGVQSSINQMMDLLKYALVVALPDTETYGFLVMVSFAFITTAWLLYICYMRREGVTVCGRGQGGFRRNKGEDYEVENPTET